MTASVVPRWQAFHQLIRRSEVKATCLGRRGRYLGFWHGPQYTRAWTLRCLGSAGHGDVSKCFERVHMQRSLRRSGAFNVAGSVPEVISFRMAILPFAQPWYAAIYLTFGWSAGASAHAIMQRLRVASPSLLACLALPPAELRAHLLRQHLRARMHPAKTVIWNEAEVPLAGMRAPCLPASLAAPGQISAGWLSGEGPPGNRK